jgi:trk system potassium uptake protein TrkH
VNRLRSLHPTQLVVIGFALAITAGAGLLSLPIATVEPGSAPLLVAFFTSTSAVCVTGLIVVDTPTYWTHFGQGVIVGLIQIGGFGIMTLTSLLALLVARRLGLRSRLIALAESGTLELGDLRRVLLGVAALSALFEAVATVLLAGRFWLSYDYEPGSALWHGFFHAISAFNNAGFALWSDSLIGFVTDPWISLTIAGAIIAGGLGFPVWLELRRLPTRPSRWSLHTKLTLSVTVVLIALGTLAVLALEWENAATIGGLGSGGKLLAAFFQGVTPRTAGFNSVDYGAMEPESLFVTDMLMFVGGGSAATAGGIKVTTLAVLALMVWAEMRGDTTVNAFDRRIPPVAQRQAFTVATLAFAACATGTLVLMATSSHSFNASLFEAISAFGTVGLSTGITADFSTIGQAVLIALMFLGRVGPQTLGVALVLRERERLFRNPEERPIIG